MAANGKIERCERRNVGIAGPVYADFSRICGALGLDRQVVATRELGRWSRRNARRAQKRLEQQAAALGGPNGNGSVSQGKG